MPPQDESPLMLLRRAAVKVRKDQESRKRAELELAEQPTFPTSLDELGAAAASVPTGAAGAVQSIAGGARRLFESIPNGEYLPQTAVFGAIERSAGRAVDWWGGLRPEGKGSFLSRQVAEGVGSSMPYLLSGGPAGASVLGALQGANTQFQIAEEKGITGPQKWKSVLAGSALGGVTERLGGLASVASRLHRVDRRSGGMLTRAFQIGRESGEEGLQEALQALGEGMIAEHLRDEDVEYFDKAFYESVKTGMAAGAFFGMLVPHNAREKTIRLGLRERFVEDGATTEQADRMVEAVFAGAEEQNVDPEDMAEVLNIVREKAAERRGEPIVQPDEVGSTASEAPESVSEVREVNGRFEFTIETPSGSRTIAVEDRATAEKLREGEIARIQEADDEARAEAATLVEPEVDTKEKAPEKAAESASEEAGAQESARRPKGAYQDAAVERFLEDRSRTPKERAALAKEAEADAKAIEEFMARKRAERESAVEPQVDEGQSGGESPKSSEKVGATPGRAEAEGVRSAFSEMDSILDSGEELHPAFAEAAKARALAKDLAPQAEADGALRLRRDDGQSAIVSRSAQKGDAPWRVTFFDDAGEPMSHVVAQNAEDATRVATREGYTPEELKTKRTPTVAALPTETDIFGQETERKPRARKEGAPVKAEQALLIDDQKGDIRGQQTLTDLEDAAKAEEDSLRSEVDSVLKERDRRAYLQADANTRTVPVVKVREAGTSRTSLDVPMLNWLRKRADPRRGRNPDRLLDVVIPELREDQGPILNNPDEARELLELADEANLSEREQAALKPALEYLRYALSNDEQLGAPFLDGTSYRVERQPDGSFRAYERVVVKGEIKRDTAIGDYRTRARARDAIGKRRFLPEEAKAEEGTATSAKIENPGFVLNRVDESEGRQLYEVEPDAFDLAWRQSGQDYVGLGGEGGISGRYERFGRWLTRTEKGREPARKIGQKIEAPTVSANVDGSPFFENGRHRFAFLRDRGQRIEVALRPEDAKRMREAGLLVESAPQAKTTPSAAPTSPSKRASTPSESVKDLRAELTAVRRMDAKSARAKYQTNSKSSAIAKVERALEAAEKAEGLETVFDRRRKNSTAAKARIKASPPKDLHTLMRRAGGVINDGGDFSRLAESDAQRGGVGESNLIQSPKSGKGVSLDRAIELAVDAGFFPGREARDIDPQEFRDALEENLSAAEAAVRSGEESEQAYRKRLEQQWEDEAQDIDETLDDADRRVIELSWETYRELTSELEPEDAQKQDAANLEPDDDLPDFIFKMYAGGVDFTTDVKNAIEDWFAAKNAKTITRDGVNYTEAQLALQLDWKKRMFDALISKRAPLDRFLGAAVAEGATISEKADVALWERMRQGRTVTRLEAERERQKPIIETIRKSPVPLDGRIDDDVTEPGFNDYLRARAAFDRNRLISQRLTEADRRRIGKERDAKIKKAEESFIRAEKRAAAELKSAERALKTKRKGSKQQLFGDEEIARAINTVRARVDAKVLRARMQMERRIQDARTEAVVHDTGLRSPNEAGSGMSNEKASRILEAVKKHKHRADFEKVAKLFDEMNARTRQALFDAHLINQLQLDEWERTQPFYAPLRSDLSEVERNHMKGMGQGISILGRESKAATGRRSDAQDTLQYAMLQSDMAIIRGEKNLVGNSLLRLIQNLHADGVLGDVADVVVGPTRPAVVNGMIRSIHDSSLKTQPNVISTKVDGQEILIEFKEGFETVAIALKNLHANEQSEFVRYMGSATRFLAAMSTRWNPVFMPRNLFRDVAGAYFNSESDKRGAGRYLLKNVKGSMRALIAESRDGKVDGEWEQYLREFREEGAPITYLDYRTIEKLSQNLEQKSRSFEEKGSIGQFFENLKALKDGVETWSDIFENSTRLAAYRMAREHMGLSKKRAALYAKEITTNFEEKGNIGNLLNSMYMFATAGIGGTRRVIQAINKVGFRRVLARSMMALAAYDIMARAIMGVDDDGEDFWDKVPDYVKERNFVIPSPAGNGDYFTIPIPYGWSFFHSLGLNTGAVISGNREVGEAGARTAFSIVDTLNPIGSTDNWLQLITPTVADPWVQISQNKDWKGSQIHKAEHHAPKGTPNHKLFWPDQATGFSAGLTRWLAETTKVKALDINPADLEHIITTYTGGLGAEMVRVFKAGEKLSKSAVDPEESGPRIDEIPLIRSFYSKQSPWDSSKRMNRNIDELEIEKNAAKDGGPAQDPERLRLYKFGNKLKAAQTKVNEEVREMKGKPRERRVQALDDARKSFNLLAAEVRRYVSIPEGSRRDQLEVINDLYRETEKKLAEAKQ